MSTAPRLATARRNWGDDDSQTPILHVDMDSFFAEVELLLNPRLRGRPVIVGGARERGVVCSATYDARARGVHAAMPTAQAARLCPEATIVPARHGVYSEYGERVRQIFLRFTPVVEPLSIDEAFLDVSSVRRIHGSPVQIAQALRATIRNEIGLPASVGVAATKLVAKTASAHAKPDGMLLIPAAQSVAFMQELPVGALWGVGAKTRARLEFAGVHTVGELAQLPLPLLRSWFGANAAQRLHDLAWARDERKVEVARAEKSLGSETTFATNLSSLSELDQVLLDQAHKLAARLRERGLLAHTVGIKVRGADFTTLTRARTLPVATDLARIIAPTAQELLHAVKIPRGGVRLLGLRLTNLAPAAAGVQAAFDEDPRAALNERALDSVRQKFGQAALAPASLLSQQGEGRGQ